MIATARTHSTAACALCCAGDLAMHIAALRATGRQLPRGTMYGTRTAVARGIRKARADRRWWIERARTQLAA